MRIRGLIVVISLVAVVLAAGCEKSVTSGGTTRYTNDEYGFSLEIADRFEQGESGMAASSGTAAFQVAFLDPDGATSGGDPRDGMDVSVYELGQAITPDLMPAFKAELERVLGDLAASDPSIQMQPLSDASVDGADGYMTEYTMTLEGLPVQARTYFLVNGATEYQITIQSSDDTWTENEPDLQKAVESFKVEAPAASPE